VLGEPRLAAGTGAVTKPVQPLGIEPLDALAHGLGVAVKFGGDLAGPRSVPAAADHPGAGNPVAGGVAAGRELADRAFLGGILGWSGR
jgi:hypothetical protein